MLPALIIGSQKLMNELTANLLTGTLNLKCRHQASLKDVSAAAGQDGKLAKIILWDCLGADLDDLWKGLLDTATSFLLRSPVVLLNVTRNCGIEKQALSHGLQGIFFVDDSAAILLKGLKAILAGELWYPRDTMTNHLKEQQNTLRASGENLANLTFKQKEILIRIASGCSNDEIAGEMHISPNTVKTHVYNIYTKIGVSNRLQAALWATRNFR